VDHRFRHADGHRVRQGQVRGPFGAGLLSADEFRLDRLPGDADGSGGDADGMANAGTGNPPPTTTSALKTCRS
jgi:hypothetical protein